jgi:hypothetical protein
MLQLTPTQYADNFRKLEKLKIPLMVHGGFGIGKSSIPRQVGAEIAKERGLKFREWCDMSMDDKKAAIDDPSKYYIFIDLRTSQMDTTSLVGIPNMSKTDLLENIPYSWVVYSTQDAANGCVFFDEINLAAPVIQSITYGVINDRTISDRRLSKNMYVFAAGNRTSDKGHTFEMALPLKDRFVEFELKHDLKDWTEWATINKINSSIISFVNFREKYLYNVEDDSEIKATTPRGLERASKLIGDLDILSGEVYHLNSMACGESFAIELQEFVKCFATIKVEDFLNNPSEIKKYEDEPSVIHAVTGAVMGRFNADLNNLKLFKQVVNVLMYVREDLGVHALRLVRPNMKYFVKHLMDDTKLMETFNSKYKKYLENIKK